MTLVHMAFLGIAPAALVGLLGVLVRSRPTGKTATTLCPVNWRLTASHLALMVLLLLAVGCLIVAESIWDAAEDGVSGLSYAVLASVVGIAVAVLLAWALAGWRRLAAVGFEILVPVVVFGALYIGWQISPITLTERRAERINQAVQRYYERNSRYPVTLADLTPWYSL